MQNYKTNSNYNLSQASLHTQNLKFLRNVYIFKFCVQIIVALFAHPLDHAKKFEKNIENLRLKLLKFLKKLKQISLLENTYVFSINIFIKFFKFFNLSRNPKIAKSALVLKSDLHSVGGVKTF